MGRSNSNALIIFQKRSLQPDHVSDVLVRRGFLLLSALPFLQIPNFKTTVAAYERHLPFQAKLATMSLRQNETALLVGGAMFGARMKLAGKHPAIALGERAVRGRLRPHASKLLRRHDQQKLPAWLRQKDELLGLLSAPPGRNGDTVLPIHDMTELAGEEFLG